MGNYEFSESAKCRQREARGNCATDAKLFPPPTILAASSRRTLEPIGIIRTAAPLATGHRADSFAHSSEGVAHAAHAAAARRNSRGKRVISSAAPGPLQSKMHGPQNARRSSAKRPASGASGTTLAGAANAVYSARFSSNAKKRAFRSRNQSVSSLGSISFSAVGNSAGATGGRETLPIRS